MPDDSLDTVRLHQCVMRWQGGDTEAANTLVRLVCQRLEHMTRKMLSRFPNVHACTETVDVLQGSLLRLLNALRQIKPESTRHFFNLAAVQVRRELLDLARHFDRSAFARPGPAGDDSDGADQSPVDAAQAATPDNDLDMWCRFHEAVDSLPSEEREVVGLVFYQGWTQVQIAKLFEVDERTIRRRWQSACVRLNQLMGDKMPSP
jgi:RNA polymerase sigma factor (sigma-70 family)